MKTSPLAKRIACRIGADVQAQFEVKSSTLAKFCKDWAEMIQQEMDSAMVNLLSEAADPS